MRLNVTQSLWKLWVIVLYHTELLQGGQKHSNVEEKQVLTCNVVDTLCPVHTDVSRAVIAQCMEEDRRWSPSSSSLAAST